MKDIIKIINTGSQKNLLKAGKLVAYSDYAVNQYNKKGTPYYHNHETLRHALRRAAAMGNADTRDSLYTQFRTERVNKKKQKRTD